ncbi:RNase J family beta-CASP ribonuclease [Scatolibacter rhodanostii]|uniref:RNase J family beta-CASP ribonuclease n=1 Tax=Scatolibacter rhodanostii TaxID=2014781 RepID=UPI001FA85032|nr:RNase J family beta-CASP ribonuclease [Scatolibacter rhodanostii]
MIDNNNKKINKMRHTPSLNSSEKQVDYMLSSADSATTAVHEQAKKEVVANAVEKPQQRQQARPKQRPQQNGQEKNAQPNRTNGQGQKPSQPRRNNRRPANATQTGTAQGNTPRGNATQPNVAAANQNNKPATNEKKTSTAEKKSENRTQPQNKNTAGKTQKSGNRRPRGQKASNKPAVKVYFLGGLNEIGKNITVFECNGDMVVVDCGLAFPSENMYGVDIVIPDFTFLEKNFDKIKGIVITHGHEDHIGSLAYLLKKINVPVYATSLTIGLIGGKLKEHNLFNQAKLNVTPPGSHIKLGCFDIELIHVNHSISDAVSLALHTPAGTIVHTGDFKIDFTPTEGEMINLARFAQLGEEGVLALMADSTNAERPGYTQTEQMVGNTLETLFGKAEGKRIIVATFASNISRVQQIINCAVKYKRKVALSGRSMLNVMGIATELGYLHVPEGLLIDLNTINRYDNGEIVLITTGSQGEPMAALSRMAFADHRQVEVGPNDFIIISARPIPGNEKTVGAVVDELLRRECTVIYESMYDVHVSGHACQEELKIMQALVKPKFFIPVHGEFKHLRKHANIAKSLGMPEKNIFIGNIGNCLEIQEGYMRKGPDVQAGSVMVDGLGVGDVGNVVLRDRKHLAEDGIIIAVCSIDATSGHVVSGPDIVSRGFVYIRESEKLMDEAQKLVYNTLEECANTGVREWNGLKQNIKEELSRFLYRKTKRSPMILPIIMEI